MRAKSHLILVNLITLTILIHDDERKLWNSLWLALPLSSGDKTYYLLLRRKALTLAVWADVVGGKYRPCQKYKALILHYFLLCSPV
jgi:hypothetical protein